MVLSIFFCRILVAMLTVCERVGDHLIFWYGVLKLGLCFFCVCVFNSCCCVMFMILFLLSVLEGCLCTVKQSWHSLYIFGIRKRKYVLITLNLWSSIIRQVIHLWISYILINMFLFNCFRERNMFMIVFSGLSWQNTRLRSIVICWRWGCRLRRLPLFIGRRQQLMDRRSFLKFCGVFLLSQHQCLVLIR